MSRGRSVGRASDRLRIESKMPRERSRANPLTRTKVSQRCQKALCVNWLSRHDMHDVQQNVY